MSISKGDKCIVWFSKFRKSPISGKEGTLTFEEVESGALLAVDERLI